MRCSVASMARRFDGVRGGSIPLPGRRSVRRLRGSRPGTALEPSPRAPPSRPHRRAVAGQAAFEATRHHSNRGVMEGPREERQVQRPRAQQELHRVADGRWQKTGTGRRKAHRGMRHERRLDLRRADVVARHDDDVVDAARDPVVAVRVAPRAVARQVVAVVAEVRVLEPARRRRAASMALSETEGPRVERQVQKRRPRRARWSRPATRATPSSPRVR